MGLNFEEIRPHIVDQIAAFCETHRMSDSAFGLRFAGDNKFVNDLRTPGYGVRLSRIEAVARRANDYAGSTPDLEEAA